MVAAPLLSCRCWRQEGTAPKLSLGAEKPPSPHPNPTLLVPPRRPERLPARRTRREALAGAGAGAGAGLQLGAAGGMLPAPRGSLPPPAWRGVPSGVARTGLRTCSMSASQTHTSSAVGLPPTLQSARRLASVPLQGITPLTEMHLPLIKTARCAWQNRPHCRVSAHRQAFPSAMQFLSKSQQYGRIPCSCSQVFGGCHYTSPF